MTNNFMNPMSNGPVPAAQQGNTGPFFNSQQPLFMQPVGNVYNLATAADIDGVPVANQMVSVGLCMSDRVLHIKNLQNGVPMTLSYRITPVDAKQLAEEKKAKEAARTSNTSAIEQKLDKVFEELAALKQKVEREDGGNVQWQI